MLARRLFGGPIPFTDSQYYTRAGKESYWISFGALMVRLARGICSVAARSGATPKSVVPAGNGVRVGVEEGALWLPESDPHDLAAQKRDAETQKRRNAETQKRRNAETQKQRITTILATLMPSAGVRRPSDVAFWRKGDTFNGCGWER